MSSSNGTDTFVLKSVPCKGAAGLNDHSCHQRKQGRGSYSSCGGRGQQLWSVSAAQLAAAMSSYAAVTKSPLQSHPKHLSAVAACTDMKFAKSSVNEDTATESDAATTA